MSSTELSSRDNDLRLVTQTTSRSYNFLANSTSYDTGGTQVGLLATETFTFPLLGAQLGDRIVWGSDIDLMDAMVTAYVSAADEVTIAVFNATGVPVNISIFYAYVVED
jgi:hypothetical protein